MLIVPFGALTGHATIAGDVVLVDNLSGKDFRHEGICQNKEQKDCSSVDKDILKNLVHLIITSFKRAARRLVSLRRLYMEISEELSINSLSLNSSQQRSMYARIFFSSFQS